MKVSREQMVQNRSRILMEAGRLFREKGFDAVSDRSCRGQSTGHGRCRRLDRRISVDAPPGPSGARLHDGGAGRSYA